MLSAVLSAGKWQGKDHHSLGARAGGPRAGGPTEKRTSASVHVLSGTYEKGSVFTTGTPNLGRWRLLRRLVSGGDLKEGRALGGGGGVTRRE